MKQHRRILSAVLAAGIVVGATGCSTVGNMATSELVAPGLAIGGASLGAFAAKDESDGTRLAATAGGGLIGWLAGLFITKGVDQEKKDEFRTGYELGQSNATKSLYWNIQGLHEAKNQPESQPTIRWMEQTGRPVPSCFRSLRIGGEYEQEKATSSATGTNQTKAGIP